MGDSPTSIRSSETEWLHGLRGLAVFIVIAGHLSLIKANLVPNVDLSGISKSGVWLFFMLSAYLLARPLAEDVERYDVAAVGAYYVKRAFRILPLYFVVLYFLVQADKFTPKQAWLHAKFFAGDFHLWTMPVEMAFYLALPLFAFVGSRMAAAYVLFGSVIAYMLSDPMQLGANSVFPLNYAVFFALGIMVAYLPKPARGWKIALAGAGIMSLTTPKALAGLAELSVAEGLAWSPLNGLGCAMLLYGSLSSPGFQAFFSQPWLTWLGRASFGAYLVHFHIMLVMRNADVHPALKGAIVFAVIAATALVAHFVIEQPMNQLGHWLARWIVPHASTSGGKRIA